MRFLLVFIMIHSVSSFSQIWTEPFDTLGYYDKLNPNPEEYLDIKSKTIKDYDSNDSIVKYHYYEYNEKGLLSKQILHTIPDTEHDTSYFYYNDEGVFQQIVLGDNDKKDITRSIDYNTAGKIERISESTPDTTTIWRFTYKKDGLLDSIIYEAGNYKVFTYDFNKQLKKKEVYRDWALKEYFVYAHPEKNVLVYQHCLINKKGNPYIPCEVVEGYFNSDGELKKIVSKYDLDSTDITTYKFERNKDGNLINFSREDNSGNSSKSVYIRNKEGLLIRVNHLDENGEVYFRSMTSYEYR